MNPIPQQLRDARRERGECPGCGVPSVPKAVKWTTGEVETIRTFPRHLPGCYVRAGERGGMGLLRNTIH